MESLFSGKYLFLWAQKFQIITNFSDEQMEVMQRLVIQHSLNPLNFPEWLSEKSIGEYLWRTLYEWFLIKSYGPDDALSSSKNVEYELTKLSPQYHLFWAERLFIRGYCLWCSDNKIEARRIWKLIEKATLNSDEAKQMQIRIDFEFQNRLIIEGRYKIAIKEIEHLLSQSVNDVFFKMRLRSALIVAYTQLGFLDKANRLLQDEYEFIEKNGYVTLQSYYSMKKIDVYLAQEKKQEALDLIESVMNIVENNIVAYGLLINEKIKTHLLRYEYSLAKKELDVLHAYILEENISPKLFDIEDNEIEIKIYENKAVDVINKLEEKIKIAQKDGSLIDELNYLVLYGRALLSLNNCQEATFFFEQALFIADSNEYSLITTDILFHISCCAYKLGDYLNFQAHLSKAGALSQKYNLRLRRACFSYLYALNCNETFSIIPFIKRLENFDIAEELENSLSFYGMLTNLSFSVKINKNATEMKENEIKRLFKLGGYAIWFSQEQIFAVNVRIGTKHVKLFHFSEQPVLSKVLEFLIASDDKFISLEQIHALTKDSPYHPLRHRATCSMIISRLRALVENVGFKIEFDRTKGIYYFDTNSITIVSLDSKVQITKIPPNINISRANKIIDIIKANGHKKTQELCDEFGVTRQALHPLLKDLVKRGDLCLIKKGPLSYYVCREN